jgi:hypothetical protein
MDGLPDCCRRAFRFPSSTTVSSPPPPQAARRVKRSRPDGPTVTSLIGLLACLLAGCQHQERSAPAMTTNARAISTPGDRFAVDVPPDTIVVLGATRRDAGDESYRGVRYDRVSDGVVRQSGRNELREPVELPAVQAHSYLYLDAVHGAGDNPPKSKLSSERIGDGIWRLHFSDGGGGGIGGMFSQPQYIVTVRFRKRDYYERAGAAKGGRQPTRTAAPTTNARVWAGPNEPVACGDLRVRLTSATVEPTTPAGAAPPDAASPANAAHASSLRLTFSVENASTTRRLAFRPWRGEDFLGAGGADHVRDNFGNSYKFIAAGPGPTTAAAAVPSAAFEPNVSLYPGKSATVQLTFEPPVDKVQFIEIELPAANVGGFKSVPLQFRVPASAVHGIVPAMP